ncbi:MAG: hypothetical protein C4541_03570, partial [Candidatus Auribacter fodinae]
MNTSDTKKVWGPFSWFYSQKRNFWRSAVVTLLIESLLLGQSPLVFAQQAPPQNEPLPEQVEPPPTEQPVDDQQPGEIPESPFMSSTNMPLNIGPESPFFDTDNDSVPGSGQEDAGEGDNQQNSTSYGLEEVITIDDTIELELGDRSALPRYKITFSLSDASTFMNTGFEDISSITKPEGGYIYSESLIGLFTQDGDMKLVYSYYKDEDGAEDEGYQVFTAIEDYAYNTQYIAEFQVTLTSIQVYVYEQGQTKPVEPEYTFEGVNNPKFYAVTFNNQPGNISLEIFKRVATGYTEVDLNNDGTTDAYYDEATGLWGIDVDGDGIPDGQGIDTNSDGIPDQFRLDQDGDGSADGDALEFDIDVDGSFVVDVPKKDRTVIGDDGTLTIYDNEGNVISTTSVGGTSSNVENFPDGSRRITTTDTEGNVTIQMYDANDLLVSQTIKEKINGVLQEPGERTGYLYENNGQIRSEYNDLNGNGSQDSGEGLTSRAVFDENQNLLSLTLFDSPRPGDMTIQIFDNNGNLSSLTIDESAERGDGFIKQYFYSNGNIQSQTTYNGLSGDEVLSLYESNGRIIEQTEIDGETSEQTISYFGYKNDSNS